MVISAKRIKSFRWVYIIVLLTMALFLIGVQFYATIESKKADEAIEHYRFPEARSRLDRCLRIWFYRPSLYLRYAQLCRRMGDFTKAEEFLEQYLEKIDQKPDEAYNLEKVLLSAQIGGLDSIVPYLRSLVAQNHPEKLLILETVCRGYMKAYRYPEALQVIEEWLNSSPSNSYALLCRGKINEHLSNLDRAVVDYREILDHVPDQLEARSRLILILTNRQRMEEVWDLFQPILPLQDQPELEIALAKCYFAKNQTDLGEKTLQNLLNKHPDNSDAHLEFGRMLLDQERYEESLRELTKAVELQPSNSESRFLLARNYHELNREKDYKREQEKADKIRQGMQRMQTIIGQELGQRPNDPELYLEVARILLDAGEFDQGFRWLEGALKLDPQNKKVLESIAEYRQKLQSNSKK